MTTPTEQLCLSLTPEQIDTFLFKSPAIPCNLTHIFGGQVLAQSLSAASRTVTEDRRAHSLHAYFLRSGNKDKPVVFYVEPLRDGGSFSTRHVVAKQDGKAIFNASISYKVPESGLQHQPTAPDAPPPLSLEKDVDRRTANGLSRAYIDPDTFSAFEFRTFGALPEEFSEGDDTTQGIWLRLKGPKPDSMLLQQCMLAFVSDFRLMGSALKPHGLKFVNPKLQSASLDHTLWFHQPFEFDDWLYYDISGPTSADSRGLNFGRFYDSNGQLIASTAQEGLMRIRD